MRSVVVVLPASMWAMMPMLRYLSSGWLRAMTSNSNALAGLMRSPAKAGIQIEFRDRLPAVVAEGAVRLGHPVRVLALLDRVAAIARRVHQLARQAAGHRLLRAVARGGDQPADRK